MRRLSVVTLSFAALLLLVLLSRQAPVAAAPSATSKCGNLGSETWTVAGSPYQVCGAGATVLPTATLTIQPGVTVVFTTGVNARLNVQGTLSALGTLTQTIVFTGPVTPNNWGGLLIDHNLGALAAADLEYVSLNNGGVAGSFQAAIQVGHGVLTLTHSLVAGSAGSGLWANSSARLTVDSTQFLNNGQDPLRLIEPPSDLPLTNLTASGSPTNSVHIQGVSALLSGAVRWFNPGIPYDIDMEFSNHAGDALTVDPGTVLRFAPFHGLTIGGALYALGAPGQPITFTAQTPAAGLWRGLTINGGAGRAAGQLDYATVEYGGGSVANIDVTNGTLAAHHSLIRFSARDGVRFGPGATGSILNSQIVGNDQVVSGAYGVENAKTNSAVLATNDWWGDPSGPASANAQCPVGHGDRVSDFVAARPVLTSSTAVNEFPLSNAPQISLSPERWFAPADGLTRVYFDITLRDGNGAPLPGRTVKLTILSGSATKADGDPTDATGHTLAYVTSSAPDADVDVSASLTTSACEFSVSPVSRVHFTPLPNITDLFPDSPAPYINKYLGVTPLPLVAGIPSTFSAKLTNPLSVPITVDVHFEIVQSSIGLAFGPLADFTGQVIPAGGSVTLRTQWTPLVSGHQCIRVAYSITGVGGQHGPLALAQADAGTLDQNFDVQHGPTTPPGGQQALDEADQALDAGSQRLAPVTHQALVGLSSGAASYLAHQDAVNLMSGPGDELPQENQSNENVQPGPATLPFMLDARRDAVFKTTRTGAPALGLDPPRQDYTVVSVPVSTTLPAVVAGPGVTPQRAAAINAASDALVNVLAYGQAAVIALDRYDGAAQAGDLTWEAEQANVHQYYQQQFSVSLIAYADRLDALVQEVNSEPYTDTQVTVAEAIAFLARLQSTGFTAQEIAEAHNAGLSDADIAAYRLELLAARPSDLAGDLRDYFTSAAADLRAAGNGLLHPYNYVPSFSVGGTAGQAPAAGGGNSMVQIYDAFDTIQVSNTFTAPMSLLVRPLNLPADWSAQVSPATVAPGQQVTATVTIVSGSPVPQGSLLSVAVEGWVGSQLAGGVEVDVAAPPFALFDGKLRVYLPLVRR